MAILDKNQTGEIGLDILYVSIGQRYGAAKVAVNLLGHFLDSKELTFLGVVDREIAKVFSSKERRIHASENSPIMFLILFVLFLKNRPKICHFNFPPLHFVPLLLLMKIAGTKIVYSFHGGILAEEKRTVNRALFIIQCKYLFDVIIANSKYSAQFLLRAERRLKGKLVIIPNGVKVEGHFESVIAPVKGSPIVLYVGRLEHIKGVDILVKAIALVKNDLPKICLHIVGEGSKRGEIEALISDFEIKENVVLHGFVTGKEKNSYYLACDMVIVPSRNETFGITVLESMLAGKPLIVSDRGALPELVKHNYNGLVVTPTPEAFANAILDLAKDKNLMASMSEANRKTAKLYDWKRISGKYIGLYKSLKGEAMHA
jgi:glycosyltransferase involved in cell wall biosynthesis